MRFVLSGSCLLLVKLGNSQILQLLLEEVHRRGLRFLIHVPSRGFSPLMIAAQLGRLDCATMLMDAGAHPLDYSSGAEFHASALDMAVVHGQPDVLRHFLLASKSRLTDFRQTWKYVDSEASRKNKPLHLAVEMRQTAAAKDLLAAGYPLDATDFWSLDNYACGRSTSVCEEGACVANGETLYKVRVCSYYATACDTH